MGFKRERRQEGGILLFGGRWLVAWLCPEQLFDPGWALPLSSLGFLLCNRQGWARSVVLHLGGARPEHHRSLGVSQEIPTSWPEDHRPGVYTPGLWPWMSSRLSPKQENRSPLGGILACSQVSPSGTAEDALNPCHWGHSRAP